MLYYIVFYHTAPYYVTVYNIVILSYIVCYFTVNVTIYYLVIYRTLSYLLYTVYDRRYFKIIWKSVSAELVRILRCLQ